MDSNDTLLASIDTTSAASDSFNLALKVLQEQQQQPEPNGSAAAALLVLKTIVGLADLDQEPSLATLASRLWKIVNTDGSRAAEGQQFVIWILSEVEREEKEEKLVTLLRNLVREA